MDNKTIKFILQSKYFLKQAGIHQSKWRKNIGIDCVVKKICSGDEFVKHWEYLDRIGLIDKTKKGAH